MEKNKCPIQIVESKSGCGIWVTLLKEIHMYKKPKVNGEGTLCYGEYEHLTPYTPNSIPSILGIFLGNGTRSCVVGDDNIRNPTIAEMTAINRALQRMKRKFNKKTMKLVSFK